MTLAINVMKCASWVCFASAFINGVYAQSANTPYPNKPIRIIVPYPPGAGTDFTAREMGKGINEAFGQPVVMDNRPGAAATLGHNLMAKATPDGYTLGLGTTGGLVSGPALLGNRIPYDPMKDFTHIGLATYVFYNVYVTPGLPVNNMKEFIAYAKSQPGKLNYASPGVGTPNHIGGAQLVTMTGINLLHVPYKGSALALADLIAGTIHMSITGFTGVLPHVKSGRIKLLAVGHNERIKMMPELPTVAETVPGYYNTGWWGLVAPAQTPVAIIARLNTEINTILRDPEAAKQLATEGAEVTAWTPAQFGAMLTENMAKWRTVAREANIRAE